MVTQKVGGLCAGMGYPPVVDPMRELQENAKFVRTTPAGLQQRSRAARPDIIVLPNSFLYNQTNRAKSLNEYQEAREKNRQPVIKSRLQN